MIVAALLEGHQIHGPDGIHEGCDTLLADLESFRAALSSMDRSPAEQWFPVAVRHLPSSEAYECSVVGPNGETTCMMLHSGIHVQIDSASRQGDTLRLDVKHSRSGCDGKPAQMATFRYVFTREGETWKVTRVEMLQAT